MKSVVCVYRKLQWIPTLSAALQSQDAKGRDHMPEHWQTLLAEQLQAQGRAVQIVPQIDHDKALRSARVANLERVVSGIEGPVVLVAHSMGCCITVHWAQQTTREIQGALLAAPADLDTPLPEALRLVEETYLRTALERSRHNQKRAARLLGLTYHQFRGLYRRLGPAL